MSNQCHYMQEESDAYIQEIESIGAAYEDMQGQNTRLLAQLADNDRVNNDLVAERVKVIIKVQETEKVFTEQTSRCEISHGGCWRCWPTTTWSLFPPQGESKNQNKCISKTRNTRQEQTDNKPDAGAAGCPSLFREWSRHGHKGIKMDRGLRLGLWPEWKRSGTHCSRPMTHEEPNV